jgi:hypothetical protein
VPLEELDELDALEELDELELLELALVVDPDEPEVVAPVTVAVVDPDPDTLPVRPAPPIGS